MAYEIIWNNNPDDARLVPDNLIPEPSCGSCIFNDGSHCTKDWNDLDSTYYLPERDDREPYETCDDYKWDEETIKEEEQ